MSLDIYIEGQPREVTCQCESCGNEHVAIKKEGFYDANITNNLIPMAKEAGIYEVVWRPAENAIQKAANLVQPLRDAIERMKSDPPRFQSLNSPNGWGMYEDLVSFLEAYLAACEANPDATFRAVTS